jgi:hypothetical protein
MTVFFAGWRAEKKDGRPGSQKTGREAKKREIQPPNGGYPTKKLDIQQKTAPSGLEDRSGR